MAEPSEWCLMEYVSVLAGESPTDRPAGTHPWPAATGRWIHDRVSSAARARLRVLGPAMVGLDGPDEAVRTTVVECLARLGAQLCPGSTLYARLLAGHGHPRRLIELGALVVDVHRATAVLAPEARDEVLTDLLADVVTAVAAVAPTDGAHRPPEPGGALRPDRAVLVEAGA